MKILLRKEWSQESKKMVDDKLSQIEKLNKAKLNDQVNNLFSADQAKISTAIEYILLYREEAFSEDQLSKIVKFIQVRDPNDPKVQDFINLLFEKKSPTIDQYFRTLTLQPDVEGGFRFKGNAFQYFTFPENSQDIKFYIEILNHTTKKMDAYQNLLYGAFRKNNKKIGKLLLNSQEMVDIAIKELANDDFASRKKFISDFWSQNFHDDEYSKTYLFKVKK